MRKTIVDLIEAVRGLGLSSVMRDGQRHLKVGVDPLAFQEALMRVSDALEAVDADSAPAAEDDAARMRAALDSTFRWIRLQGLSTEEPLALVAEALGQKGKKRQASYDILPAFAPQHKRKKGWKPRLSLPRNQVATMRTIDDHRKAAADMDQVNLRMGAVLPAEETYSGPGMR
jgi:hypothetical protein